MKIKSFAKWPSSLPVPAAIKSRGTFTLVCVDSLLHAAQGKTEHQLEKNRILLRCSITRTDGLCLLNHSTAFSYQDDSEVP